jgi:hypothetical protein
MCTKLVTNKLNLRTSKRPSENKSLGLTKFNSNSIGIFFLLKFQSMFTFLALSCKTGFDAMCWAACLSLLYQSVWTVPFTSLPQNQI